MGSNAADEIPKVGEAEGSDTSIEIKIKTLDSRTYSLRVDKQMPVPALKERIASVTGVLSEQQRLICRGRVLMDDQLLSAYQVEDGHTLHLVVRQPVPPASESSPSQTAPEPDSNGGRTRGSSIVIETFSMPHQGEGVPAELSRVVSAILGSIGIPGIGSGGEGNVVGEIDGQRPEGILNGTAPPQQQAGRDQSSPLQPPVIPDSLTTLSQYLGQLKREFDAISRGEGNNVPAEHDAAFHSTTEGRHLNLNTLSGSQQQGLPSPALLAEVLMSARQFLTGQAGDNLLQLARQLENQANVVDPVARSANQTSAFSTGVLFHNVGAFLLELGRSITTLRLGNSPSEAIVNAGPAVFISPSGPNPLMVQPFNFQSGAGIGGSQMGTIQPSSSIINGVGTGIRPRRIDIQIRRGSSMSTPNTSRAEIGDSHQQSGQRDVDRSTGSEVHANQETLRVSEGPSFVGDSGIRVLPIRTMVAAVPRSLSRLPTDSTGNTIGIYPMLGTIQQAVSESLNGNHESQANGEHNPGAAAQYVQGSYGVFERHRQNTEDTRDNGPRPTPGLRQQESSSARSGRGVSIGILSAGVNTPDEGQIPDSMLQYIRNIFPGGEVHEENIRVEAGSSNQVYAGTSDVAATPREEEGRASEEGVFLSNILQQIMPVISQHSSLEPNVASGEANVSDPMVAGDSADQAGDSNASHRRSDSEPSPPSSKRQKME